MAEFPALPLWTDALIGDTYQLTPAEFGAYMRLLIVAWRRPDCNLPNDDAFLGRSAGDPKNWHRLKTNVMAYWKLGADGFLTQKRLTDERTYVRNILARSSAGGRGKALKGRHSTPAKQVPKECQNSAPTPTPIISTVVPTVENRRASRWPPHRTIPIDWMLFAAEVRKSHGLAQINLALEAEKFANYWASKSGRDATKTDWRKTWINWALRAEGGKNGYGKAPSANDKFLAGAAQFIASLDGPAESEGGGVGPDAAGRPLLPP